MDISPLPGGQKVIWQHKLCKHPSNQGSAYHGSPALSTYNYGMCAMKPWLWSTSCLVNAHAPFMRGP